MAPKISEQMINTMSTIMLAYLKGASCNIPDKPSIKSAKNKARTITAIVNAAIQSPFCTETILRVATRPVPQSY